MEQRTVEGRKITRIAATNVSLILGGATPVVSVTQGHGNFLLSSEGIAGELAATVDLSGVPGVTFTGQFGVRSTIRARALLIPLMRAEKR